jgi:hypothetical protein
MTLVQEDTLYEYLLKQEEVFSLKEITSAVRAKDSSRFGRLSTEIAQLITNGRLAFSVGVNKWLTRAGCFTGAQFVIRPTKDELVNGILIPGHRFLPFANPMTAQKDYVCKWRGKKIPWTDTEASPEDIYPYYTLYGEEFAPQLVARENSANEEAFNADPYEDPPEVSIKTLDMRAIYREAAFVPGDRLLVTMRNWQKSIFELERVEAAAWSANELNAWQEAAEEGFRRSFEKIGPKCSTEEQAAWAFFLGGQRTRSVPAYSLEDLLYEKSDKIESVPFGIESRFWYAGKEIPDYTRLEGIQTQSDQTPIEKTLLRYNIPISEFVLQSYVYDALFRDDTELAAVLERIVPSPIRLRRWDLEILGSYIFDTFQELKDDYTIFIDKKTGPLRQRAAELHTAVVDLAVRLEKGEIDPTWLPKHSFVILSQIQNHAAAILEDLISIDDVPENEMRAIENSLDSMLDTYEDIKEMIDKSLDEYRRSNITLVRNTTTEGPVWRTVQISIGGTEVWRRLVLPQTTRLFELHKLIQGLFGWTEIFPFRFLFDYTSHLELLDDQGCVKTSLMLSDLSGQGFSELSYEYGACWTVKVIILAVHNEGENETIRCVAGEYAAPPERIEGPLRFRRFLSSLDSHREDERNTARAHLGAHFDKDLFDANESNKQLAAIVAKLTRRTKAIERGGHNET